MDPVSPPATPHWLVGAALTALVSACGPGASPAADPEASPPVLQIAQVVEKDLCEPILGTGVIAAAKTTNVGPRVDGVIDRIFVDVGDRVRASGPLFRTRQVDYRIRLQAAQADLELARAEAKQAERDLWRIRTLRDRQVASAEQLESAGTRSDIAAARVQAAAAALRRARQDLQDTVVTAPYDGVITGRLVDEGAMMRAMMSPGSPVVQIMKTDEVLAIVRVPEIHLPRIAIGTPGRVRIDGLDREVESSVHILNDLVDPATHTVEVRLLIPNPDLVLKPGLFVKAELEPEPRVVKMLRRDAVLGIGEDRYVFVERDGRAARKSIHVRDLDALHVEVLSGIAPDERILVGSGLSLITDGAPVRIRASADGKARVAL